MITELPSGENPDLNSLNKDKLFRLLGGSYDDETLTTLLSDVKPEVLAKEIELLEEKLKNDTFDPEQIRGSFIEHLWYMYIV